MQETDKDFARLRLLVYSVWTLVGGEGGQKAADLATKVLNELSKAFFPYQKRMDDKKRDQTELNILEKVFRATGMGDVVDEAKGKPQGKAQAQGRESLWQKMINLGKKKE